ncbi:MAG: hypothetical protein LQ348_001019 [Seirophora lacunosa]|nr:MAG: hypothetical protein LQ348_001019 [Seirophora lacunosa]
MNSANPGEYHTNSPTPTSIPNDVPLSAYGVGQSKELAIAVGELDPPVTSVFSSPFYRCLQTIEPAITRLGENVKVRVDNGIGEWYGHSSTFTHPAPPSLSLLCTKYFPSLKINPDYRPSCIPSPSGETIAELHDRVAYALSCIIQTVDSETRAEEEVSILICTHAATLIAIGRCLTGNMPSDVGQEDYLAPCAGLTKFVRRKASARQEFGNSKDGAGNADWKEGKGVAGGWNCELNGNCDHLAAGAERTWHFSGEEAFSDPESTVVGPGALTKQSQFRHGQPSVNSTKAKI